MYARVGICLRYWFLMTGHASTSVEANDSGGGHGWAHRASGHRLSVVGAGPSAGAGTGDAPPQECHGRASTLSSSSSSSAAAVAAGPELEKGKRVFTRMRGSFDEEGGSVGAAFAKAATVAEAAARAKVAAVSEAEAAAAAMAEAEAAMAAKDLPLFGPPGEEFKASKMMSDCTDSCYYCSPHPLLYHSLLGVLSNWCATISSPC